MNNLQANPSRGDNTQQNDSPGRPLGAEQLNRTCFCQTLNRQQLAFLIKKQRLNKQLIDNPSQPDLANREPALFSDALFSDSRVYIAAKQREQMREIIDAVERVVALPAYAEHVHQQVPSSAALHHGPAGVFMGYDFHLTTDGPKLIEINSNAGGAFLNHALQQAQIPCPHTQPLPITCPPTTFEETVLTMFKHEWVLQRGEQPLRTIAIVDDQPAQQFLYAEFKMAQQLLASQGIDVTIANANDLIFTHGQLQHDDRKIDLVYNRLTDFYFTENHSRALQQAYVAGAVVVTPNPHHHAFYADKRRLMMLGDPQVLATLGATAADRLTLSQGIPRTQIVIANDAPQLWQDRKQLFFKPAIGYGSRAAYRGDKLTQRVWQDIQQQAYVAQQLVAPSERSLLVNGSLTQLKMDVRAYTYDGTIQLLAARLYQGQTTNFRTPGGGFAPVIVV
jgi:archaeosine-15-forming tRNA-guanine transglycosylase